jgi:hypothetical protein
MLTFESVLGILILMLAAAPRRAAAQTIAPLPSDSLAPIQPGSVCGRRGLPFVGPCQTVHAMLFATNGTPGARLWKVGTKRVLGVWEWVGEGSPCPLPPDLNKFICTEDKLVYADFVVRPVTQSVPGYMQMVCVASASSIVLRPAYFIHPHPR